MSDAARRQGIVGTKLLRWGAATRIEFEHERTDQRREQPQRQRMVTAGIDVDADLSIYDPRLLKATIAATIAQSHAKARGPVDGTDTSSVPRYYLRAEVARDRAISGYALAEREDDRSFSRARFIRQSTERAEVGLSARFASYRGYLTARRSRSDIRGIDESGNRQIDSKFVTAGVESSSRDTRTSVDLTLDDIDEEPVGRDERTRRIDIRNTYRARGPGGLPRFRFGTAAQLWRQRTGEDTQDRARFAEDVDVELHENLSSHTSFEYRRFSNSFDTQNRALRQEFQHRLFDSLVTTVGGFRERDDYFDDNNGAGDGRTDRYGMDASIEYSKETFLGDLTAGFDMSKERQKDDLAGSTRPVFGESAVLATGRTTLLREVDVRRSTVEVRDSTNAVKYVRNVDYRLSQSGRRTRLVRIATGLIPDGATVLVDYEFQTTGDTDFETSSRAAHVSLRMLDALSAYASESRVRQSELSGDSSLRLEDSDTTVHGADLDWKGLRLSGETEQHRATFSPFDERRVSGSYDLDLVDNLLLTLFRTQSRTEFDRGADLRVRTQGGTLSWTPARNLNIEAQPVWEEDRGRGEDRDILDLRVRASYSVGRLRLELLVDHREDDQFRDRVSDTRIIFSVVREW